MGYSEAEGLRADTTLSEAPRTLRKKTKFLFDDGLSTSIAALLRELPCNAITATSAGIAGQSVDEVYLYARKTQRTIVTQRTDYVDDGRFPIDQSPGVIVLPRCDGRHHAVNQSIRLGMSLIATGTHGPIGGKFEVDGAGIWTIREFDAAREKVSSRRLRPAAHGEAFEPADA